MDILLARGISNGILMTGWAVIALAMPDLQLPVWVGVAAWAGFYASGGGREGLRKTVAASMSGCLWAALVLTLQAALGGGVFMLSFLVGLMAFVLCMQAVLAVFSFIPGAFLGAAAWIGASGGTLAAPNLRICICLLAGAALGYVSELAAKRLEES